MVFLTSGKGPEEGSGPLQSEATLEGTVKNNNRRFSHIVLMNKIIQSAVRSH